MNANLETLRKLMTSYIRGDSLFIDVFLKRHVTNILLRFQELQIHCRELEEGTDIL